MKPSEILDGAANIILRDGWHQGEYYREVGGADVPVELLIEASEEANRTAPCCQDGAISRAAFGVAWVGAQNAEGVRSAPDYRERREARRQAIEYMKMEVGSSPVAWNDEPDRTKEEVVAAFRRAADRARFYDE